MAFEREILRFSRAHNSMRVDVHPFSMSKRGQDLRACSKMTSVPAGV